MVRSERLLAILQALRARRRPVTAKALAERFEVSERTIYRDMRVLASRGAVVEGSAGIGYLLRSDYFLPPLSFNQQEAAAILLGLRFVLRRGDQALVEAASHVRAKLVSAVPAHFDEHGALLAPFLVGPPRAARNDTLGIVRQAISEERKLRLRYRSAGKQARLRVVWPAVLGWFDETEMLGAWCETRRAFRNFRIDRIELAQVLDESPPRSRQELLAEFRRLEPKAEF